MKTIKGNLVDVDKNEIYPVIIKYDTKVRQINRLNEPCDNFILPGLIDAHIHIESTMLTPSRFAEVVIPHGTVATVSDPHEIANVAGVKGVKFMIHDSPREMKLNYTAPSCVPATQFETSGAELDSKKVKQLLKLKQVVALGEVMNYPGVINRDPELMRKIRFARLAGKRVDGHAPMLTGLNLDKYISAGITTEHESTSYKEGLEKLRKGMKLMIRQGFSEHNMPDLIQLARQYPDDCFIVSDDRHAPDLVRGHIDELLRQAVALGLDPLIAVKCCTKNPSIHYGLNTGLIRVGLSADFVVVNDLCHFYVEQVIINGQLVAEKGECLVKFKQHNFPLRINYYPLRRDDFVIKADSDFVNARVIGIIRRQIITKDLTMRLKVKNGLLMPDESKGVSYLAVVNRYKKTSPAMALVKGLWVDGAIASSVSHDSHNIIVTGNDPDDMLKAVRLVMRHGGLAFASGKKSFVVPLEVAGLMTNKPLNKLLDELSTIKKMVRSADCALASPFMQLSFLALLVIPELKLSDKGLFDAKRFCLIKPEQRFKEIND
ncbi:MAG: adenine deaminase [Candidatus Nanoarchaeia archaeon]|jgi:adenine deaminase